MSPNAAYTAANREIDVNWKCSSPMKIFVYKFIDY